MALSRKYFAKQNGISDSDSLEEYLAKVPVVKSPAESHFLHHVLFPHARDFDRRFPWFDLNSWRSEFRVLSASWIVSNIRSEYDSFEWSHQYDLPADGSADWLPARMKEAKTWPFVPVIFEIRDSLLLQQETDLPLFPYHLIEGNRRMNFLRLILADGTISPDSFHTIVVLTRANTFTRRRLAWTFSGQLLRKKGGRWVLNQ
jgi:hypothetical protein